MHSAQLARWGFDAENRCSYLVRIDATPWKAAPLPHVGFEERDGLLHIGPDIYVLTFTVLNPPPRSRRRVYPYSISTTGSKRRDACQLQRGMQRPSEWVARKRVLLSLSPFHDSTSYFASSARGLSWWRPLREVLLPSCALDQRPSRFPGLHRWHGRAGCVRAYNCSLDQKPELIR